jgi:hypothetical protein
MPKDQPETHQDQESQKLVDRIEKKASAAQRLATPKRNLKVVKWDRHHTCRWCLQLLLYAVQGSHDRHEERSRTHESLRVRFTEHKCKPEDASRKR